MAQPPQRLRDHGRRSVKRLLRTCLGSKDGRPARDHLTAKPIPIDGSTKDGGRYDWLVVPGGDLDRFEHDQELIDDVCRLGSACSNLLSVCTGAFLVAAGFAGGKLMATHSQ